MVGPNGPSSEVLQHGVDHGFDADELERAHPRRRNDELLDNRGSGQTPLPFAVDVTVTSDTPSVNVIEMSRVKEPLDPGE